MCALFAATYPDRTTALILFGGYARRLLGARLSVGQLGEEYDAFLEEIERDWGGPVGLDARAPSMAMILGSATTGRATCAWARARRRSLP